VPLTFVVLSDAECDHRPVRPLRNALAVLTGLAFAAAAAAYLYAATTDTSQSDSNANLGETWGQIWLLVGCAGLLATAFAALLTRADRTERG
jgi:hypothetical protein